MNYVLTENFLFTHDTCTSIKFTKSSKLEIYEDFNSRTFVVNYITNTKLSDLARYFNIEVRKDSLVSDSQYFLRVNAGTIINGLQYYVSNNYNLLSCVLIQDDHVSRLINAGGVLTILSNHKTLSEYLEFLNSTTSLYVKVIDESKFMISNFNDVDLRLRFNRTFNNPYVPVYKDYAINESMIVAAFVNSLKRNFTEYTIAPELTKDFVRSQKQKIMIYDAKLAEHGVDYSTHVRKTSNFGRIAQITLQVQIEILTDDLETYINIRDQLLMNTHLFQMTKFVLVDQYNREWSYGIDWSENELNSEIDRTPKSQYFDETVLYSIPVNAKLIGYLVEKFAFPPTIAKVLSFIYTSKSSSDNLIELSSAVVDGKLKKDLKVGLEIDLGGTELYYLINGIYNIASIDRNTGNFKITTDLGAPYRGNINKLNGQVSFNERIADNVKLPMNDGTLILKTKLNNNSLALRSVVAEIVGESEYSKISSNYKFASKCNIDGKVYYLVANSTKLLELMQEHFGELFTGSRVKIISSQFSTSNNSPFTVFDYKTYNLFNYVDNKFERIKGES